MFCHMKEMFLKMSHQTSEEDDYSLTMMTKIIIIMIMMTKIIVIIITKKTKKLLTTYKIHHTQYTYPNAQSVTDKRMYLALLYFCTFHFV